MPGMASRALQVYSARAEGEGGGGADLGRSVRNMVERGVGRRRRWRADDKGRIIAESYAAGAVVSEVARRHDITPQQLFVWRKAARAGQLTLPAAGAPMYPAELR